MEVLPYRRYRLLIKTKGFEWALRCYNLRVQKLRPEEAASYPEPFKEGATHLFSFRDTDQVHTYLGILKEDSPEKMAFETPEGREFEFRPLFPEGDEKHPSLGSIDGRGAL